jgi:pimeloyl-ACP methyl ester carboxylesterase
MRAARRLTTIAALLTITTIAASCSDSDDGNSSSDADATTSTTTVIPAPEGLPAFYAVPDPVPNDEPGSLIKLEKVDAPDIDGTVYRVMYVSSTVHGDPVPVTGVVVVPPGDAPEGGWPVVTWAHGTNGQADECAPSLSPAESAPIANQLLEQGWLITATDYQGEGTPGLHPYIVGRAAARDTIDIVRAAQELPGANASDDYVVWGHSQGGHTAMHALDIGESYDGDLELKGVVAGAPPSQFNLLYDFLKTSPFKHYLLMVAGGYNAAYGDEEAPLDAILTDDGQAMIAELENGCSGDVAERFKDVDVASVVSGNPFSVPEWKTILEDNDPQNFTTASPSPLLIIQGGADEQIPPVSTQILARQLCAHDQNLTRWIYPNQSHAGVIAPSAGDMITWIQHRFANQTKTVEPSPDPYAPTGMAGVEVTKCPE